MAAVAHFPSTLDDQLLERARRPLATIAAVLLAIDLIGLGLRITDAGDSPVAESPIRAKARVGAPEAVVPGSSVFGSQTERRDAARARRPAQPVGCLALSSGCYPGGTTTPGEPGGGTTTPGEPGGGTTPPEPGPVPVAQAGIGVPALGAHVSVGLGEGSCTSVELTVIALGDCPVSSGDGPVVLSLGGSLLGG